VPDVGHPTVPSPGSSLPDVGLGGLSGTIGDVLAPITSGKPATVISDLSNYIVSGYYLTPPINTGADVS
jgi:hypothetical protein